METVIRYTSEQCSLYRSYGKPTHVADRAFETLPLPSPTRDLLRGSPRLKETIIRTWTGDKTLAPGQTEVMRDHFFEPRNLIRAYTSGSEEFTHVRTWSTARYSTQPIRKRTVNPHEPLDTRLPSSPPQSWLELQGKEWSYWFTKDQQTGITHRHDLQHQGIPSWEDFVNYEGYRVPRDVCDKVYNLIGEDMYWESGMGRNLALPEEAWDVLREWGRRMAAEELMPAQGGRAVVYEWTTCGMVGNMIKVAMIVVWVLCWELAESYA